MSDLASVRAEIKSWERDFASLHGRDPSIQDIRDIPDIADKYKRYKKLSKPLPTNEAPSRPRPSSQQNPFTTPVKNTYRRSTPSPDPFPTTNASSSTTALSRARKRLRGEPVSPSPNKPKRQCIPSQSAPDFSSSDHESDKELPQFDLASSFVADSPVKAPAGGKSFKLLFNDALPPLSVPNKLVAPSASQPFPLSNPATASKHRVNPIQDKIFADLLPSHKLPFKIASSDLSQSRGSAKRALVDQDLVNPLREPAVPPHPQYPLVPPSPPPHDSTNKDTAKPKVKATASRKKLRVEHEDSDEGVHSSDDVTLKIRTVKFDRARHSHLTDNLDWGPLLHHGTHNRDLAVNNQINHALGTFSVDLPDKFRHVVAISPSRNQSGMEERVVRGVLYGDRVGHYNPSRGGDIWDAGEMHEGAHGSPDTEVDWEGEPVPWEVGEL